jgi:hypothetical protein
MTSIHNRTIGRLSATYPEAKTHGFPRAVSELRTELDDNEPWRPNILPDLWWIDRECVSVICIEVEDRHPIDAGALGWSAVPTLGSLQKGEACPHLEPRRC